MNSTPAVRYATIVVAAIVFLVLGAFGGFYLFLRSKESSTDATNAARGLNSNSPSFQGGIGSTYQNIVSAITGLGKNEPSESAASGPVRYWKVSDTPISGFGWESSTTITFVERATGYVFTSDVSSHQNSRISGMLIPKTYEALVAPGGYVIERGINDAGVITTFSGKIVEGTSTAATSSPSSLSGTALLPGISHMQASAGTHTILYTIKDSQGISLFTAGWDGTGAKRVFASSIEGWRLYPLTDSNVIVQNASDGVMGYSYRIDKNGVLQDLFALPGLVVLPHPSTPSYLVSGSKDGVISLLSKTAATTTTLELPIHTSAEKCAWLSGPSLIAYCAVPASITSKHFLDDWYRGIIHPADELWQVDAGQGTAQMIFSPQNESGLSLDVKDPAIDPSGNYIAFTNAVDQSLWVVRIAP